MIIFGNPHASFRQGPKTSKQMILTADHIMNIINLKFMLGPVEVVYF